MNLNLSVPVWERSVQKVFSATQDVFPGKVLRPLVAEVVILLEFSHMFAASDDFHDV